MSEAILEIDAAAEPVRTRAAWYDRTLPLFFSFLLVGVVCVVTAYKSVYDRPADLIVNNSGAKRAHVVVTRWMKDGYFHFAGLMVHDPVKDAVYRSSTGAYMVSLLLVERIYGAMRGHYSWRLAAFHNVVVSLLIASLAGLLAYRMTRRMTLAPRLAFVAGASVTILLFTFPDNLALFWEMTAQAYWMVCAMLFLLQHERAADGRRTRALSIMQALTAFVMTMMEPVAAMAFLASFGMTILLLEQDQPRERWKRFALLAVLPFVAAMLLFQVQKRVAQVRFPETAFHGSEALFRSGLDGESLYYGDHIDIALRRDVPRLNWPINGAYLFRWKWVFLLGSISTLAMVAAYVAGRVPRVAIEAMTAMVGGWLLYAAVFSQAFVIHPYLYDLLLFAPLVMVLFAFVPALAESMTRRTGGIVLVAVFCALWYAMFQMRLYALWFPAPGAKAAPTAPNT